MPKANTEWWKFWVGGMSHDWRLKKSQRSNPSYYAFEAPWAPWEVHHRTSKGTWTYVSFPGMASVNTNSYLIFPQRFLWLETLANLTVFHNWSWLQAISFLDLQHRYYESPKSSQDTSPVRYSHIRCYTLAKRKVCNVVVLEKQWFTSNTSDGCSLDCVHFPSC